MSWSKLINGGISGSEEDDDRSELEFDDYSGISAPLYEVADAIFDFPAQKFFRRQVLYLFTHPHSLSGIRCFKSCARSYPFWPAMPSMSI